MRWRLQVELAVQLCSPRQFIQLSSIKASHPRRLVSAIPAADDCLLPAQVLGAAGARACPASAQHRSRRRRGRWAPRAAAPGAPARPAARSPRRPRTGPGCARAATEPVQRRHCSQPAPAQHHRCPESRCLWPRCAPPRSSSAPPRRAREGRECAQRPPAGPPRRGRCPGMWRPGRVGMRSGGPTVGRSMHAAALPRAARLRNPGPGCTARAAAPAAQDTTSRAQTRC